MGWWDHVGGKGETARRVTGTPRPPPPLNPVEHIPGGRQDSPLTCLAESRPPKLFACEPLKALEFVAKVYMYQDDQQPTLFFFLAIYLGRKLACLIHLPRSYRMSTSDISYIQRVDYQSGHVVILPAPYLNFIEWFRMAQRKRHI